MARDHAVFLALALACLAVLAAVGGVATQERPGLGGAVLQTGDVNPDDVSLRADVAADGDATWTIEYRVRLATENETAAFESLQSDVQENTSDYRERFASRMRNTVAAAGNATGREMAVRNVSVTAEVRQLPQTYGVVRYRFTWTDFAAVEGNQVIVGDAVSGLFLDAESQLILSWPGEYALQQVDPEPTERRESAVVWNGPTDFARDEPRLVVAPAGTNLPGGPLAALLFVVVLGVAGGWWWRRRERRDEVTTGPAGTSSEADATEETTEEPTKAEEGDEEPSLDLLSPEERVLRLLRERGGRMKQQEVVQELDWTAARTSQVVGSLREDGEVETFRLGRENVLKLPEADLEVDETDE